MTVLFSNNAGKVSVLSDKSAGSMIALATIRATAQGGHNDFNGDIILTKISSNQQTNTQFLNTIGGSVYIYVFGDRVGQLTLGGLCFDNDCSKTSEFPVRHGVENLLVWYKNNKVTNAESPMSISIGLQTIFSGHLLSLNVDGSDAASRVVSFNAVFATIPALSQFADRKTTISR